MSGYLASSSATLSRIVLALTVRFDLSKSKFTPRSTIVSPVPQPASDTRSPGAGVLHGGGGGGGGSVSSESSADVQPGSAGKSVLPSPSLSCVSLQIAAGGTTATGSAG